MVSRRTDMSTCGPNRTGAGCNLEKQSCACGQGGRRPEYTTSSPKCDAWTVVVYDEYWRDSWIPQQSLNTWTQRFPGCSKPRLYLQVRMLGKAPVGPKLVMQFPS